MPISTIESMDTLIDRSMGPRRFNLYLLGAFAAVSLALAAIGLFGVMATWWHSARARSASGWPWARREEQCSA